MILLLFDPELSKDTFQVLDAPTCKGWNEGVPMIIRIQLLLHSSTTCGAWNLWRAAWAQ